MNAVLDFPIKGLTEQALEISRRRRDTLVAIKAAIRNRDLETANRLITELVPDDEESDRAHPRKYRIASRKR